MATEPNITAKYVIIGGGLTGATAAKTIRHTDKHGTILLICGEEHLPYHRPPLSKEYLRGDAGWADARISTEDEYKQSDVQLLHGVRATNLDTSAKTITLADGRTVGYEKLCLATGASAKPLDVPGADAPNVYMVRTVDDSDRLAAALIEGRSVVVVGSGYLGMETAAVARQKGLDVTVIGTSDRPWDKNTSPEFGKFLQAYYESQGVAFLNSDGVTEIGTGETGLAVSLTTKSGKKLVCDLVIAAVGAKLNLELAKSAGLTVDDKQGVTVNEFLETDVPGVYAAGDIACFHDPVLQKSWHVEHWQNAEWHGQVVGANMAGHPTPYNHVPWFFSDEFDLHMTLRGDPQGGKSSFAIGSMEPDTDRFLELYLREDGTLAMGLLISKKLDETATSDLLETLVRQHALIAPHKSELQSGLMQLHSLLK